MIEKFYKNAANVSIILLIAAGVGTVGSVIINDVRKPNSAILSCTALILLLAGSMTIKEYIADSFSSENDLEEEYEDVDSEVGVSCSDDGGRCSS